MPQYIPISLNAIEVRKLNLKELLKVDGSDIDLVREAKYRIVVLTVRQDKKRHL
jgi:hypothetical protein